MGTGNYTKLDLHRIRIRCNMLVKISTKTVKYTQRESHRFLSGVGLRAKCCPARAYRHRSQKHCERLSFIKVCTFSCILGQLKTTFSASVVHTCNSGPRDKYEIYRQVGVLHTSGGWTPIFSRLRYWL